MQGRLEQLVGKPKYWAVARTPSVEGSLDWRRTPAVKLFVQAMVDGTRREVREAGNMAHSSEDSVIFTSATRAAFLQHVRENPNNRRISESDKTITLEWLTNPYRRPSSQEEFSRRNYVRKTFIWDEKTQNILAVGKKNQGKDRLVVPTDIIVDVVETVHKENGHGGWDATWKDVSTSYYGILRADVIFLLKQCQECSGKPSKRPKTSTAEIFNSRPTNDGFLEFLNTTNFSYDNSTAGVQENEKQQ